MMWRSSNTIRTGHDATDSTLLTGGQYAEGWILFLTRIERMAVVEYDKNIKNPLERMEGFALLLCFRSGLIRASS